MDRISAVKLWRDVTNGLDVPTDRAVHMFAHLASERETSKLRDAFEALKVAHAVAITAERERWARIASAAQAVTVGCEDTGEDFILPSHLMSALALALDEAQADEPKCPERAKYCAEAIRMRSNV